MKNSGLRAQVLQTKHLPPLSVTANQLLAKVADSDVALDDLADIIGQDPGLSAHILGLANAASFCQTRPVTSLREAMVRVGLDRVRGIAVSMAMGGVFDTSKCPGFDLRDYWSAALGCAELAKMVTLKLPAPVRPDPGAVYLCGLLHNLGALIIAYVFPAQCSEVYRAYHQDPSKDIFALERALVGISRRQAMEWLGIRWHLPGFVVGAASQHMDMTYTGPGDTMILVVGAAARSVKGSKVGPARLADDPVVRDRLRLMPHQLDGIEDRFRARQEELRALGEMLSQSPG